MIGGGILGDQTQGEAVIAGMNLMGYHAMALGSKELSLGVDLLGQRMKEAQFPVLSANVVLTGTTELVALPYTVLEVGEHRVGILGLTQVPSKYRAGFEVLDPEQELRHYVPQVAEEADTVIVLTSMQYREALALVDDVPGVDLVVAARPDQLPSQAVRSPGTGTLVVTAEQPVSRHTGRRVGRLVVTLEGDGGLSGEEWESRSMDPQIPDDPDMRALLDRYRQ